MLKVPDYMYGKGPKNNPAPGKSWDTSGSYAFGDAALRNLTRDNSAEPHREKKFNVELSAFRMKK
jgi:hypothetical protein